MDSKAMICRTGEIYLKKGNKNYFEKQLKDNMMKFLSQNNIKYTKISYVGSRIIIYGCDNLDVKNVCGLTSVSPAIIVRDCIDIKNAEKALLEAVKEEFTEPTDAQKKTFKVQCHRVNKNYPMKSPDVQKLLGGIVLANFDVIPKMKNPDVTINIEIIGNSFFIFTKKITAVGGLPVGVGGKTVSLLSGGIDSPVSSFLMMKRGCKVIYVHFEGKPYTSSESDQKVKDLAKTLNKYQFNSKLYIIPFGEIQKKLSLSIKTSLLVIFYRKLMFYIAEKIKEKEKCTSLCTGENLGQVASQTMKNMAAIEDSCNSLILRPLIAYDKEQIIEIAKNIGTYETSSLPFDDCCTLFNPKLPETNAKLNEVRSFWDKIINEGFLEMAEEAIIKAEIFNYP